jgi:myo-inositol-1(or 4)-monophosphatase
VVYAPALDETYAAADGMGARLNGEPIRPSDARTLENLGMVGDPALFTRAPWSATRVERRNSIAYRMALIAAGAFDAAVALGPKWDWDVAAGAAIATEAGAVVSDDQGRPFRFNQADPRQPGLLCAAPGIHRLLLERAEAA